MHIVSQATGFTFPPARFWARDLWDPGCDGAERDLKVPKMHFDSARQKKTSSTTVWQWLQCGRFVQAPWRVSTHLRGKSFTSLVFKQLSVRHFDCLGVFCHAAGRRAARWHVAATGRSPSPPTADWTLSPRSHDETCSFCAKNNCWSVYLIAVCVCVCVWVRGGSTSIAPSPQDRSSLHCREIKSHRPINIPHKVNVL